MTASRKPEEGFTYEDRSNRERRLEVRKVDAKAAGDRHVQGRLKYPGHSTNRRRYSCSFEIFEKVWR